MAEFRMARFTTLRSADVGSFVLDAFGSRWPVEDFMGRIMEQDVGKRVYRVGDILQVESDAQRTQRQRTDIIKLRQGGYRVDLNAAS
jgi:sigma54-dependent transcription regulator